MIRFPAIISYFYVFVSNLWSDLSIGGNEFGLGLLVIHIYLDLYFIYPAETFNLAYSMMDSSRVSTFIISILLIVYGSFRSLAMEEGKGEEGDEKEKKESNITTLDSLQAMCLPLGASVSLLIMFFFFDSMQVSAR